LGTRAVLGLGGEHEARIVRIDAVQLVIVVIHPGPQPLAQALDERLGDLVEAAPAARVRERDVEHHHLAAHLGWLGQLARRAKMKLRHGRAVRRLAIPRLPWHGPLADATCPGAVVACAPWPPSMIPCSGRRSKIPWSRRISPSSGKSTPARCATTIPRATAGASSW